MPPATSHELFNIIALTIYSFANANPAAPFRAVVVAQTSPKKQDPNGIVFHIFLSRTINCLCKRFFLLFYFQSIGYPTLCIWLHRRTYHPCTTIAPQRMVSETANPFRVNGTARSVLCRNAFILMIRVRIVNSTTHPTCAERFHRTNVPTEHTRLPSRWCNFEPRSPGHGYFMGRCSIFSDRSTLSVTCRSL